MTGGIDLEEPFGCLADARCRSALAQKAVRLAAASAAALAAALMVRAPSGAAVALPVAPAVLVAAVAVRTLVPAAAVLGMLALPLRMAAGLIAGLEVVARASPAGMGGALLMPGGPPGAIFHRIITK